MGAYENAWKYLDRLPKELMDSARSAVKGVTWEKAQKVYSAMRSATPVIKRKWQPTADHGKWPKCDLKNALKIVEVSPGTRSRSGAEVIGYKVIYDDYYYYTPSKNSAQGKAQQRKVAYQLIANSLNSGFIIASDIPNWTGKYVASSMGYMNKCLKYLINMDEEISRRFQKECAKRGYKL